jgi:protein-S-isoprenylcysteine O-methyltransferase Ste14
MPVVSLVLLVAWVVTVAGARGVISYRQTGTIPLTVITDGPLRWVRNPIFSGTLTAEVGFALLVPNLLAMLMLVSGVAALEIQVRRVEEPYLLETHGDAYRQYAGRTGRFLPGVGRLRGGG